MNFSYVHNVESDEPIMLINKHIGFDETDGMGVDGSLFQQEMLALDAMGKKRIQVWINSVGGLVMDGYNIANAILKSKTPVDTYCVGMAASIAGVIFQCGRKRIMSDYSILMYHNPYAGDTTQSPLLDTMKESLNTIISNKSGMGVDAVHRMMDRTSYIGALESKQMGLCDEIEATVKLNTKYYPKVANDNKAFMMEANKVLNKIFDKQKKQVMLKVTNKLKLNAEANEDAILSAIESVENRANVAEEALNAANKKSSEEMEKMKNELEEMKKKCSDMEKSYNAAKAELEEASNKAKEAEEKAAEEKAKNLVHDAVKIGKIKNDAKVIAEWIEDGKADFEKIKGRIDAIPVNKTAAKFEIKVAETKEQGSSVAVEMAKIANKLDNKN